MAQGSQQGKLPHDIRPTFELIWHRTVWWLQFGAIESFYCLSSTSAYQDRSNSVIDHECR